MILDIIKKRRTVKPDKYSGETVSKEKIEKLLEAAHWAPTHGFTEPWSFVVFEGASKDALTEQLIAWDANDAGENEIRAQKTRERFAPATHIIAIGMKRGENPKIPVIEELLSVGMAVQNMWLAATELGLGAYWSTGAIAFDDRLKAYMGLGEHDQPLGLFFVGDFKGEYHEGRRLSTWEQHVVWK